MQEIKEELPVLEERLERFKNKQKPNVISKKRKIENTNFGDLYSCFAWNYWTDFIGCWVC